ncbi:Uma2 family endonuclease [Streptomyces sp. GZWMJZ-114]|uniref:Uma2 family endonuclease n=1 Tax=Streptomyces sp. GZWMJZ-114 TaxID=2494734 RepID=UPI001011CEB6|nr:Uma2 family endonuclease [Streptomyces sp. GZWMJZ-114]
MTPKSEAPADMTVEEFEQIARTAPETVRLEYLNGKIEGKPVPDGRHDEIIMWLLEQCLQHRPDLRLYPERGLKVEKYRRGRARPDGVLAPRRHFLTSGDWAEPDGVLMVAEVTSHDWDTHQRDRVEKAKGYAAAGIPVYLLIDRQAGGFVVYAEPDDGGYRSVTARAFGAPIELPEPVGRTLESDELKEMAG